MDKWTDLPERINVLAIKNDLKKKMVFIGGPRQIGKTTIATGLLKKFLPGDSRYLNWDNELDRKTIVRGDWDKQQALMIFDEIHKKKGWQNLIKGYWDTWKGQQNFIVTGSARLDLFRKGGDSLMGRYHYHRIHPYSLPELIGFQGLNAQKAFDLLFKFGGFPEPLINQDETQLRRWHLQRISRLVRIDLRDLESVSDLDKIEMMTDSLAMRISSPLSYKSLAEDVEVSDKTVKRWVRILDSLYYLHLVAPFGSPKIKAVKKSTKLYLWDWSEVAEPGARFENLVANHLLKLCHYWEDVLGHRSELRYIRDQTGRECDFVVIKDKKPLFAVECKLSEKNIDPNILFFQNKLKIPRWYQVHADCSDEKIRQLNPGLQVLSFAQFCKLEHLV